MAITIVALEGDETGQELLALDDELRPVRGDGRTRLRKGSEKG